MGADAVIEGDTGKDRPVPPWAGVIPPADAAAFSGGFEVDEARPFVAGERPALIVVDMTRAFVDSAYPKGWGETGWPAVRATQALLNDARGAGIPVFYTQAYPSPEHRPRPAERGNWRQPPTADTRSSTDPPRAPDLPPGDVIVDELTPRQDEIVIYKGSKPSAFFGTPLIAHLTHAHVDTVLVAGMTTSGCVRATVVDAFSYNLRVVVPTECVADRSQISHKVGLFDMQMKYADVIALDRARHYLSELGG